MRTCLSLGLALTVGFAGAHDAEAQPSSAPPVAKAADGSGQLAIPFEKLTLKNGMVVILSEDHTVPLVAVNLMVKVGSRFERDKRSGFAHLFEHLMFMGTERVPSGAFDKWMESEGGWNNAWTSEDRTDYFDVAPAHALPLLLWMEADRVGALGSTMTIEKLEAQRKVVRNERRQTSENKPYGKVELRLPELLFPVGHPYHHPVIGSHEDLEAATVDDVKSFFSEYYAANNLSLVVAGDFDVSATRAEIEKMFSSLPAVSVPVAPPSTPVKLAGVVRETLVEDNIQLAKIIMAWHSPARFAPGDADLDILANVLDRGKTSRLYKALVFDKELAQSVNASQGSQDLSSIFQIEAIARPGVGLDEIEKEIDRVLSEVVAKGVTAAEVERSKNDYETSFVLQLESVPERASILNTYQTFAGDPGFIGKDLERYRKVDVNAVNATAKSTLDLGSRVIMRVEPKAAPKPGKPGKAVAPKEAPPKAVPPKEAPPKVVPPKAVPPKAVPPKEAPKSAPPKAQPPKAAPPKNAPKGGSK